MRAPICPPDEDMYRARKPSDDKTASSVEREVARESYGHQLDIYEAREEIAAVLRRYHLERVIDRVLADFDDLARQADPAVAWDSNAKPFSAWTDRKGRSFAERLVRNIGKAASHKIIELILLRDPGDEDPTEPARFRKKVISLAERV
jgi:hypothetical protein